MRFNSLILLLLSLVTVVVAGHPYQYTPLDIAQYTCNAWITNHNPVCLAPKEWGGHNYDCYCNSIPAFATIMDCFINGYDNSSQIINGFAKVCNMTYDSMYIKYQLALNFNTIAFRNFSFDMLSKRWDTLTEDQLAKTPFLYNYTNGSFAVYQKSYELFYQNTNHSIVYSTILFIYWAVVLLFATIINFVLKKYLGCMINAFIGKFVNWYRKNIGLPAAFNKSKCKEVLYSGGLFSGFIPSRLESLILAGFIILTIVFSGLNIYHIPGNPKDPTVRQELSGLIATRTGVLVQYLVILLILFAGRNNFFQWLTGWKYSTFLTYHRWISRVVIALVFVHGVTYAIYDKANGTFARNMKTNNVVWGTVACVCGGFIFLFGMIFFRIRTYEFFYISHVLLVILFVVGTLYHVKPLSYDDYYWAAVAVWVFDRVIRLLKMFSFGIKTAELELVANETIRITIPTPRSWKPRPGGHVFIHFLTSTRFWQSHPFTIGLNEEDSFILYCKVKTGITLALYDKLSNTPNRISSMKVLVEGPYGEGSPARRCRNMVYVAGGNGIPGLYAESVDVDKKAPENKTIKLVWIIRNWKSVLWFVDELKRLKDTRVQPTVFITRPDDLNGLEYFNELGSHKKPHNSFEDEKENIEKSDTKSADLSIYSYPNSVIANLRGELPNVEFVEGKPSMDALVEYETANTDLSIAFITCGHPVMVDELRHAVTQNLDNTKYRVDYFEQLQNW